MLKSSIPKIKFKFWNDIGKYLEDKLRAYTTPRVYLFTYDDNEEVPEIIISEDVEFIIATYKRSGVFNTRQNYYLQEFYSYEEAYKVALAMREPLPMCYEPESELLN